MAPNSKSVVFFVNFGTNKVRSIDSAGMQKRVCGTRTHRHSANRTAALSKPGELHLQRERVSPASFQRDGLLVTPWGVRHQPRTWEACAAVSLARHSAFHKLFRPSCVSIIRARWWSGKYDVTGGLIEAECVHSPVPGGTSCFSFVAALRGSG